MKNFLLGGEIEVVLTAEDVPNTVFRTMTPGSLVQS